MSRPGGPGDAGGPESESRGEKQTSRLPGWLAAVILAEAAALMIALVTPITPSKTGGPAWTPADMFSTDPSYLEEVAASFVLVNVLIAVIGLVAWVAVRRGSH